MSKYKVGFTLIVILFLLYIIGYFLVTPLLSGGIGACNFCDSFRSAVTDRVYSYLPSPHAELLLGTTLGIDNLFLTPRFNDVLKSTGTIHVVVVSGYNISLVINRILNLIRNTNSFAKVFTAQILAGMYAVITGFEPPVVRALLMASVVLWARFYGKRIHIPLVLLVTAGFMIALSPSYLVSLSFQLSFLATLGIVLLYPRVEPQVQKLFGKNIFSEDFSATFSAQLFVAPLLYYQLNVLNLHGVIINTFTLWLIPILTLLGFVVIAAAFIHPFTGIFTSVVYLLLSNIFISLVAFSSNF